MKDILIFLLGVFGGKLIEDNLPNLHYKNLAAGFEKHITPTLLTAYLGFLFLNTKINRSKQTKKNYTELLTLIALLIVTDKKQQVL